MTKPQNKTERVLVRLMADPDEREKVTYCAAATDQGEFVNLCAFNRAYGAKALLGLQVEDCYLVINGHYELPKDGYHKRNLVISQARDATPDEIATFPSLKYKVRQTISAKAGEQVMLSGLYRIESAEGGHLVLIPV